jgi:hypothetical protein
MVAFQASDMLNGVGAWGGVTSQPGLDGSGPTTKTKDAIDQYRLWESWPLNERITAVESFSGYVPTRIYEPRRGDGMYSVCNSSHGCR